MSGIIAFLVQLAGAAGVKLSPFKAGAIVAGVIAAVVGLSLLAAGVHLYNVGYAAADGAWREKALEAQLAAARADQAAARLAAADAEARATFILHQAEQERAGTDAYVEDLKKQNEQLATAGKSNVCGLTCADLRGMRIQSAAAPLRRDLPPPDQKIFAPVGDPSAKLRDDARERLARTRDALKEANDRLVAAGAWYEGVRRTYSGEGGKRQNRHPSRPLCARWRS